MRTLILMRHAKAEPDDGEVADAERALNRRGREAAPLVARELIGRNFWPDYVACSSARRTVETLDLVLGEAYAAGRKKPDVKYEHELYLAEAPSLIERARWLPKSVSTAMLVGHNPGMHEAAFQLARKARGAAEQILSDQLASRFPTGTAAVLVFDAESWRDIAAKSGKLAAFIRPRDLAP